MGVTIVSALVASKLMHRSKPWADGRGGLTMDELVKQTGLPWELVAQTVAHMLNKNQLVYAISDLNPKIRMPSYYYYIAARPV